MKKAKPILPTKLELANRMGQIFTCCSSCGKAVWFDCLDREGINEFIENKDVCYACGLIDNL